MFLLDVRYPGLVYFPSAVVDDIELLVPMAGPADVKAESTRLPKEIEKRSKDLARVEGKFNNPKFVDKASSEVVAKEKDKLTDMRSTQERLQQQLVKISNL
ncbi:hypothetical protein [Microbulbifer sp. GL-2]|uniref:hypothetical protein n=1 Tax=Microbulbifer sp. GL-2 TaxID=2591606 RepID=UPI0011642D13|nr:hypothetical protein [Microbulbifer sp. GL-2]BBM00263.1 hypothetical protein GL2_03370 [Microbulbifer sp. GL-2]